jgi:hypothetical protein
MIRVWGSNIESTDGNGAYPSGIVCLSYSKAFTRFMEAQLGMQL